MAGLGRGHVELPPQLADEGDARRAGEGAADLHLARGAEREAPRRQVLAGQRLETGPAARPHHPEGGPCGGDVRHHALGLRGDVAAEPVEVADRARRRRHHPVPALREAGDGEVGLDAPALVQPVGVDDAPRLDVHVGGAHPLQDAGRVPPFHEELGEARLVEEGGPFARRAVLGRRMLEPVLAAEGVFVDRLHARRRVPVGPLPAGRLAEARAARGEALVERGVADVPRRLVLPERIVARVEEPQGLAHPLPEVAPGVLDRDHPADVVAGEVEGGVPPVHPFRDRLADPAPGLDPHRVEAARDEEVPEPRRLPDVELVVRGEALRAAEEAPPADLAEDRDPAHRVLEDRHELLLGVARQLVEAEVGGKLGDVDGARDRLEGADEEAPRVLPDVGRDVVVAQGREAEGDIRDLRGVGVVVLAGVEGHVDPRHPSDLPPPEARAVHHEVGLDVARVRPDPGNPAVLAADGGDRRLFEAARPPVPGSPDEGRDHVDGARRPVGRNPGPADQPFLVDERVEGGDLVRGDEVHPGDPEPVVHRGEALQLLEAVPAVGDGEAPDRPEPGRLPGLLLDLGEQPARVVEELRQALVGPHGADEAGRVPGRPAREAPAFEEQHVAPAEPGEVVGGARADDPAADDDGRGPFR